MPVVLILSSFVAASRVGGYAQSMALAAEGVEAFLAPTVLFGRHPGLGPPGGGAVPDVLFEGVLTGAEARGAFMADAILTGYFAGAGQVRAAAAALRRAKAAGGARFVLLDPILGDEETGLYVKPEVERAVLDELTPFADLLAPNAFELGRLTGAAPRGPEEALEAARALDRPLLVSSIPCGPGRIGVLYAGPDGAVLAVHARQEGAPKGTGDLLKAHFLAGLLKGRTPPEALGVAVADVAAAVAAAVGAGAGELPLCGVRAGPVDVSLSILA
jgi:pyridoxine kinase